MNSSHLLGAMCAAMLDDIWLERIQDEIDAMPDAFEWEDDPHYEDTLEYISYQDDVEFWRHGGA